jgi:hypothetical protein
VCVLGDRVVIDERAVVLTREARLLDDGEGLAGLLAAQLPSPALGVVR